MVNSVVQLPFLPLVEPWICPPLRRLAKPGRGYISTRVNVQEFVGVEGLVVVGGGQLMLREVWTVTLQDPCVIFTLYEPDLSALNPPRIGEACVEEKPLGPLQA